MKKMKNFLVYIILLISLLVNHQSYAIENSVSNINLIIAFKENKIDNDVKSFITKSGGQIISEIPEASSIEVVIDDKLISQVENLPNVQAVSYNQELKLEKNETTKFIDNNVKNFISSPDYINTISKYRLISQIENQSNVHIASCNEQIELEKHDLYNNCQWDIKKVTHNGESFALESGNHSVVVGIIDSGVNKTHPDLSANFLGGKNFIPKSFKNDSSETGDINDVEDRMGHGTHVAGAIAGNGRILGVAPNIGFKSYRVFDSKGHTTASIVCSAIIQAVQDGVKVINLSVDAYGVKGTCILKDPSTGKIKNLDNNMADYLLYERAIKYATDKGVIVVTSSGNNSLDCLDNHSITEYLNKKYSYEGLEYNGLGYEYPGSIKGVINVSATGKSNKIASYSNYGDGFITIAAPGGEFDENKKDQSDMCLSTYKNDYIYARGTSVATPKVSAVAALIICQNPNIKPEEVIKKIKESAYIVECGNSSKYYGCGIVDAYEALKHKN